MYTSSFNISAHTHTHLPDTSWLWWTLLAVCWGRGRKEERVGASNTMQSSNYVHKSFREHTSASLKGPALLVFKRLELIIRFQPAANENGISGDWEQRTEHSSCDQVSGESFVSCISLVNVVWLLKCVVFTLLHLQRSTISWVSKLIVCSLY